MTGTTPAFLIFNGFENGVPLCPFPDGIHILVSSPVSMILALGDDL